MVERDVEVEVRLLLLVIVLVVLLIVLFVGRCAGVRMKRHVCLVMTLFVRVESRYCTVMLELGVTESSMVVEVMVPRMGGGGSLLVRTQAKRKSNLIEIKQT